MVKVIEESDTECKKQSDKDLRKKAKLAQALRQNLLRRKQVKSDSDKNK